MNSNHVVDFLQFTREDGTKSGIIGVGKSDFNPIENLVVGEVTIFPFNFSSARVFQGPIQVDVSEDGFIVEKLADGAVGDMFVNADLYNFTATVLSNQSNFTNWSVECKPVNICLDYQSVQYAVACPGEDLFLVSKCYDQDYKTTWLNPYGDTIICDKDTLRVNNPVPVGLYQWITPCNKGYVLVYHPDSIRIEAKQVFCSSKQKLFLPTGLKGDWSSSAKNVNYIYVSQPGWYFVTVSDCLIDSIFAEPQYKAIDLELNFAPNVDTLLFNKELDISVDAISNVNIMWYKDGSPVGGYLRRPGLYTIIGTLDECREYDTLLMIPHLFSECDWDVYKPNVFSPNDDGDNDLFQVFGPDGSVSEIWVYNRWGGLIYSGHAWDGTCGGKELQPDVYTFRAHVVWKFEECNKIYGDVTLIR